MSSNGCGNCGTCKICTNTVAEIGCMDDIPNPNYNECTVCNGDTKNNIWFVNGKCLLDTSSYETIYMTLKRNPNAKADLLRITSDPVLRQLAMDTVFLADEQKADEAVTQKIARGRIPFYSLFKGKMGGFLSWI